MIDAEERMRMLKYDWQERGNLECSSYFDRAWLQENHPMILRVWDDWVHAENLLTTLLKDF